VVLCWHTGRKCVERGAGWSATAQLAALLYCTLPPPPSHRIPRTGLSPNSAMRCGANTSCPLLKICKS
jgi:hypothetical protein